MGKNKVENSLDVNIFQYMNEAFQVDFRTDRNVIGCSDLHYGQKKVVIEKIHNIKSPSSMRQLFGKIIHELIEYKPIRTKIVRDINKEYGIKCKPVSKVKDERLKEILPEQFLRFHPDTRTPHYIIEEKTHAMPVRNWKRETALQHVLQLNDYVCEYKVGFGILLVINMNAFLSGSKSWEYILNTFSYTIRFEPNYNQFKKDLNLTKYLFECINEEVYDHLPCPVAGDWECANCIKKTREYCGKERYTCQDYSVEKEKKHGYEMFDYPNELTGKFTDSPLCETCFQRIYPHSTYEKWKYLNYSKKS